jgi:hypothetical protein
MKENLLGLLKNKSFFVGLFAGIFITSMAAIILVSISSPPANPKHLKGTMSGWIPVVGMTGTVVEVYGTTSGPCPLDPTNTCTLGQYTVSFPEENNIMCYGNTNYPMGQQVVISSTTLPGPINVYVMTSQ